MINLYNQDCLPAMRDMPDKAYELAIVDPPYGIGADNVKESITKKTHAHGEIRRKAYSGNWDTSAPIQGYFDELFRVSKDQIIWGGNYFIESLKCTRCMVMWDKESMDFTGADFELAWTSFDSSCKAFRMSRVMAYSNPRKADREIRIHPTQKPVRLYEWLLQNYAKPGDRILDTHGGSGSICIACDILGFDLDWYEIDADYFQAAKERLERHQRQGVLTL